MNKAISFMIKLAALLALDSAILILCSSAVLAQYDAIYPFAISFLLLSLLVFNATVLLFGEIRSALGVPIAASMTIVGFLYFLVSLILILLTASTISVTLFLIIALILLAVTAAIFYGLYAAGVQSRTDGSTRL